LNVIIHPLMLALPALGQVWAVGIDLFWGHRYAYRSVRETLKKTSWFWQNTRIPPA